MREYHTGSLLAMSVDPQWARVCLLEPMQGNCRLVGWADARIANDVALPAGLEHACRRLAEELGRVLWDVEAGRPLLHSSEPAIRPPLNQITIVANPLPLLRVWLGGLSTGGSLLAAAQAIASSSAQLVACYRPEEAADPERLAAELDLLAPDVAMVVGGYDVQRPDAQAPVLALCELLGQALSRVEPERRPYVLYAGNRWAGTTAETLLQAVDGQVALECVANVQPAPNLFRQSVVASALSRYYWTRCSAHRGLAELAGWATSPGQIRGIDWAFAQAVRVWMVYRSLPQLHGLYCGPCWWLHVWAAQAEVGVRMRVVSPHCRPDDLADWPPVQLVSGAWPEHLWPRPIQHWWDREGLVPAVMGVGQVDVQAALQVLVHDLLST